MTRVSVIVPVFNVEEYLPKCLESLVSQTLTDLEIIVINDGSTDDSQRVISGFAERYPQKIKAFIKENGGLSAARNFGLKKATGEYIGFVDGDDYVNVEMFAELYRLAEKYQAEISVCNLQKVDARGNLIKRLPQIPNLPESVELADDFSPFADLSYFACNKLFKRFLFDDLRFNEGIHFEDIELVPRLLLKCSRIAHTNEFLYHYLERPNSISRNYSAKGLDILTAVKTMEAAFHHSIYAARLKELKGFQILEGVYTFLAYLAFVKEESTFYRMSEELKMFMKTRRIRLFDLVTFKRFGSNYLLSLPFKKQIYYLLYFCGQKRILRQLM